MRYRGFDRVGLKPFPQGWNSWRDFAPLYVMVNLPLIITIAATMAYMPTAKPISFASVTRESIFTMYLMGAIFSSLLSFPWQWRFLHRRIAHFCETGFFSVAIFAIGYYWRNVLVSCITVAVLAIPLVYLIFFLVSIPLAIMLLPVHLISGVVIGLIIAKFLTAH